MHRFRQALAAVLLAAAPSAAVAQHALAPAGGTYDPAVPTPEQVLGYPLGSRFTPHHLITRYVERLAVASPRVTVDTLGHTFEGREVVMVVVTAERHHARLGEIRDAARRLAHPGAAPAAEIDRLAAATPSVAWLGFTVHGNEASGTEAALGVLYQLAAGRDANTLALLDSLVVLVDPVQNPDGHERHVQDVARRRGALGVPTTPGAMIHQGNWPGARTSHYHFDLNRDWFLHSHPETRARVRAFNTWFPHVAVDLHEMGSNSTYFFAPPMEPVNPNVPQSIRDWWDVYAAANAAAFDREGWSYFRREGYDEFYPGYGVSWPILTGAVGMTYEQASSSGGAIRRSDGTLLTLLDAARHHYTAAMATLDATMRRRAERVRDYVAFRRTAVTEGARPYRAVILANDGQGRADSLAQLLVRNGIAVGRVRDAGQGTGTAYGERQSRTARWTAGSYVVDLAQPQGRLARALLEPDAALDSAFIREELEARRTGRPDRFYDITGWSLPHAFRVEAFTTNAVPAGAEPVAEAVAREPGVVVPDDAAVARARYGYAFEPGSEASLRLLSGLLADGARVWRAQRGFTAAGRTFPHGAFVVRTADNAAGDAPAHHVDASLRVGVPATPAADPAAARRVHERVLTLAAAAGVAVTPLASSLVDDGTDLGSNSVVAVRAPRVALLGGDGVQGNSFGFTWYAFDQRLAYPTTAVAAGAVAGGILRDFDVLVIPSASPGALDGALGQGGRDRLAAWVRDGGVLVTIEGATAWLAREQSGLSRFRLRAEEAPGDGGAALPASAPGAIVRAAADTISPLLAGVAGAELAVLAQSDRVFEAPRDVRPGEIVLRHAGADRLLLAGYLWPELPARIAGAPVLWTERAGRGRVIAFTGDPNFRDLWRGMLPVFANAVFLGGTF